ncbi:phosphoglycan beta 1 2 arabinosyltransferase (SCA like) (SCAL) [Leptomonas seymouri]|uniref:Phosphoglycan beta 1 2 arabinosyltransferase (SCA like) (SCAL) n=1 Tax=Leptomonas seymouri TaxID=5684 RepID=A0A0N1HW42_LEPSE|nr:phosphoglycan beta 1 2 arabinosyltransferase (SCA like) (SCAL) [Leptomonas seymouri]|eukprot:KPI86181.1 phosphoglycan beta 1 2 arabinosyltransferase (SCA like) (SCAL) [Leptomonas seymouri]
MRRPLRCFSVRFMALIILILVLAFTFLALFDRITLNIDTPDASQVLQQSTFFEDEVNAKAMHPQFARSEGVCAVCAEGHILFRADILYACDGGSADAFGAAADAKPTLRDFTVCLESIEDATIRPAAQRPLLSPLCTARDCVARLHNLGLLQPPRATATSAYHTACVQLRVSLQVLGAAVTAPAHCSAVVAQLRRPQSASTPQLLELTMPRLTVWPMKHTMGLDESNSSSTSKPLYFGAAAVKETDVDSDLPPPSMITVQKTLHEITVKFGSVDATQGDSTAASPDLRCPPHFLTVRLGRFGRHHDQLQKILNTLALAAQLNRTIIVPPFVPVLDGDFLRLNTEVLYGWHALREVGRYCLLTYTEARPVLQQIYATAETWAVMTMERVHFAIDATASEKWKQTPEQAIERHVWGYLPRLPRSNTTTTAAAAAPSPMYDADEWFACGVRKTRSGQALLHHLDDKELRLVFREISSPFTQAHLNLEGEGNHTSWEKYRAGVHALIKRYSGSSRQRVKDDRNTYNQPDMVVLSSFTAFQLRPRLAEMSRMLGLLRPSPYITSEIGRFYRLWAPQYKWPVYTNPKRTFDDCLQPHRFKNVVGLHVLRHEHTCREEAEHLSQTIVSLSKGRYVFNGATRVQASNKPAPAPSTRVRLANDCVWDVRSAVHLFYQYSRWLGKEDSESGRHTQAGARAEGLEDDSAHQHYTSYVADDEQSRSIGPEMEVALQRQYNPAKGELLGDGKRLSFTAMYDRRSLIDAYEAYRRARKRIKAPAVDPKNATAVEEAAAWEMDCLIELLYPKVEIELMSIAFDFFMLSNTGVFRGSTTSSMSIDVCIRRWGRGLPCHGVIAGYYEALYKGFS